jgi:hypothetical protein
MDSIATGLGDLARKQLRGYDNAGTVLRAPDAGFGAGTCGDSLTSTPGMMVSITSDEPALDKTPRDNTGAAGQSRCTGVSNDEKKS